MHSVCRLNLHNRLHWLRAKSSGCEQNKYGRREREARGKERPCEGGLKNITVSAANFVFASLSKLPGTQVMIKMAGLCFHCKLWMRSPPTPLQWSGNSFDAKRKPQNNTQTPIIILRFSGFSFIDIFLFPDTCLFLFLIKKNIYS